MNIKEIINKLNIKEKIGMLSGADDWCLKNPVNLPKLKMSDGPNGLRLVEGDIHKSNIDLESDDQNQSNNKVINMDSKTATCFPTLSVLANSWDKHLIYENGRFLAEEATASGVHVVLAPGVNIKRNPLCGRNFEYFSEDPFLAGELGASFVMGLQFMGVGACLKHFAANNKEEKRMVYSSYIDERALREIYLRPFERIVTEAKPKAVMTSYNKLNGEYCSNSTRLINDILRKEWGYEGVVMSDWGGTYDRVEALKAGLDLEMPCSNGCFDKELETALNKGEITNEEIDKSLERILELIDSTYVNSCGEMKLEEHADFASLAAESSAVLLKNEDMLPINGDVAIFGESAINPIIQGGGSSKVNPYYSMNLIDAFNNHKLGEVLYCNTFCEDAIKKTQMYKDIIVVIGKSSSEGYDIDEPTVDDNIAKLLILLKNAGHRVAVVVVSAGFIEMPWADYADAILYMGLAGQGSYEAIANIIYGKVNPSGKLSETYPYLYSDCISSDSYKSQQYDLKYLESIYVGYRYYDKNGMDVRYPFGFGLSYTSFAYSDLLVKKISDYDYTVTVNITNTGSVSGAEVIQLYVGDKSKDSFRPQKELKGFEKVFLQPNEKVTVNLNLDYRSFAYYNVNLYKWSVLCGEYSIMVGSSSRDIRLSKDIMLNGESSTTTYPKFYHTCKGELKESDFMNLYNGQITPYVIPKRGFFSIMSTPNEMKNTLAGKILIKNLTQRALSSGVKGSQEYNLIYFASLDMPLSSLCLMSNGVLKKSRAQGLVDMANGRFIKGLVKVIKNK